MRGLGAALSASVMVATVAMADTPALVAQTFVRFEDRCAEAIRAPQSYVNSVPNPDSKGTRTLSVSPDGKVVRLRHASRDGLTEDVIFIRFPESLMVYCAVHADGVHVDFANAASAVESYEAASQYGSRIVAPLKTYLQGRQDLALVGGNLPIEWGYAYAGQVHKIEDPENHLFGFMLDVDGTAVPSGVGIEQGGMTLRTFHNIEVGQ